MQDNDWVEQLVEQKIKWRELPADWTERKRADIRLEAVTRLVNKPKLKFKIRKNGVVEAAAGRNCEQMIGEVTVPMGAVGPIKLHGDKKEYWVPLATTEGALVASVQRGVKVVGLSGGVKVKVRDEGVTRAPVFRVGGISEANKLMKWVENNQSWLGRVTEKTSSHLKLKKVEMAGVGRNVYIKFRFDSGEAMGMNMATIATRKMAEVVEKKTGTRCVAVSGNGCVDKKPAWGNVLTGRGLSIQAEVVISKEMVKKELKTTSKKIIEVVMRKDWLGSAMTGAMGFNGHFANMVAAMFLATGQDMAHVVEGSLGITTAEVEKDELYFSVNLPNVMVGTVGGGTGLPVQRAALQIMGLSEGKEGEREQLGKLLGAVVLSGELSLTAALASGDLAGAHQKLARGGR